MIIFLQTLSFALRDIGSFPNGAIPGEVFDLAGNSWEWVSSTYANYLYNPTGRRENLTDSQVRVTRGGGQGSHADELTTTYRVQHVPRNFRSGHHNIGFRCAH